METERMKTALDHAETNTDLRRILSENSALIKNLDIRLDEKDIHTSKTLWKLKNSQYCSSLLALRECKKRENNFEISSQPSQII